MSAGNNYNNNNYYASSLSSSSASSTFLQPVVGGGSAHPAFLRDRLPSAPPMCVALDGHLGAPAGGRNASARRIALDDAAHGVTSMRAASLELPLAAVRQFTGARTVFAVNSAPCAIPWGNYASAIDLLSKLTAATADADALVFDYATSAGRVARVARVVNPSSTQSVSLVWAVDADHVAGQRSATLGYALGFRQPAYVLPPGGSAYAEARLDLRPVRTLTLCVTTQAAYLRNDFYAHDARDAIARVALPAAVAAPDEATLLVANLANGLLASGTRAFQGGAGVQIRDFVVALVDNHGLPADLDGDSFSLVLELYRGG